MPKLVPKNKIKQVKSNFIIMIYLDSKLYEENVLQDILLPSTLNRVQMDDSPKSSKRFSFNRIQRIDTQKEYEVEIVNENKGEFTKEDFALPNFYSTWKTDFGSILQTLNKNEKADIEEQNKLFDIESHIQNRGNII